VDIEFDKEKFKQYKYAIIASVSTSLVAIIAIFIIIIPLYQATNAKAKEQEAVGKTLKYLQEKEVVLNNLKTQEEDLKKTSEKISAALPPDNDVGPLFIQLSELIVANGGKINGISGSGMESTATTQEKMTSMVNLKKFTYVLPIEFSGYSLMKSFIAESKKALRLIEVSSIVVAASDNGKMNATITINTYARSE